MSHKLIVKKFASRTINKRTGIVSWKGSNIFCDEDTIYSYGRHFPMAVYLGEHPKYKYFFIKNTDKYSSSTSCHQGMVSHSCAGPEVPRLALNNAVADAETLKFESEFELGGKKHEISVFINPDVKDVFSSLKIDNVYLWRKGFRKHLWKDIETGTYYEDYVPSGKLEDSSQTELYIDECKIPKYAQFNKFRNQNNARFHSGFASALEVVVLKINEKYFVCNHINVWLLSGKPKNISEALKMRSSKLHTGS